MHRLFRISEFQRLAANTTAADLQPAALTTAMTALANHNKTVTTALVDVRNAIAEREDRYEDEKTGLKSQFQQA